MPYMMKKIKLIVTLLSCWTTAMVMGQGSNSLSSSPYSIYGLGVLNTSNTGVSNALGRTGIAMPFNFAINNLNPASYATIPKNRFLFDVGIKFQRDYLYEDGLQEHRLNGNFSNMAFAFAINEKSGIGLTLIPFTNVGYRLVGLESNIEGTSGDNFTSNVSGEGGLNDFKLNYGYTFGSKLRVGLTASALFGKIEEREDSFINNSTLNISDRNYYSGVRLGAGLQYEVSPKLSLGATVNLPTSLNGTRESEVFLDGLSIEDEEESISDFKLPLELGFGVFSQLNSKWSMSMDYKYNLWSATDQSDFLGDYVDQQTYGIGIQYVRDNTSLKYWKHIAFRASYHYDSGNLAVNGEKIRNYELTAGIGLPLNLVKQSKLNIGYAYGQKGLVDNGLVKEYYHTLTINLNLSDLWFQKRKYN